MSTDSSIENDRFPFTKADEPILQWFTFDHLKNEQLRSVSERFALLAQEVMRLPRSAERTVALRKLLESKDAAVRAAMVEGRNA